MERALKGISRGLDPDFPKSPYAFLDPATRWFPADEGLRKTTSDKLMPPLVVQFWRKVKEFLDGGYAGAARTSKNSLNWRSHLLPRADGTIAEFRYYFGQREAMETIVYMIDVVGVKASST